MSFFISRHLLRRIAVSQPNSVKNALYRRSFTTQTAQEPPPASKTKQFMKKYGYVGIGVYLALGAIDLTATMALISVKGAKYVCEVEDYVIGKAKSMVGMKHTPHAEEMNERPSFMSLFVIAYGIHKTLLLPFRLSVTAAITPAVARKLHSLGWVQRMNKK